VSKSFYEHCLTEELQAKVAEQLKLLMSEQLTLNQEVAVHRQRCADAVKQWSDARQVVKHAEAVLQRDPDNENLRQMLRVANAHVNAAGERMAEAMKTQKDIVGTAAVTDSKTREALTQNTLMLLLNAVVDLVHEYWNEGTKDSIAKLAQFEDELRERVVFQEADQQSLAVEYEFQAMLENVPGPNSQSLIEG